MKLVGLFVTLLAAGRPKKRPAKSTKHVRREADGKSLHDRRLQWASETDAVVLIDYENVRGKTNFDLTHNELLRRTTEWSKANGLEDKVAMIVDHGSLHSSYYLEDAGIGMVFAGPKMKADDVLARDVAFFENNAIVITADNELKSRCRNAMEKSEADVEVQFIQPIKFITDLEILNNKLKRSNSDSTIEGSDDSSTDDGQAESLLTEELANSINEEIQIRSSMYETETQMREKKNMNTPKKRRKLEKRARMLCERLAMKGGQSIDHLTTLNGVTEYDRRFQDEVLSQWANLREAATRREMTGDRILLAEHFRRQIEKKTVTALEKSKTDSKTFQYVNHIQSIIGNNMATSLGSGGIKSSKGGDALAGGENNGPVRLVVVSDTHGYEESLTPRGTVLPKGDILLHLGDFAIDGSLKKKNKAIQKFDEWMSRQPHRTKIVLRGNHDPFTCRFPLSDANFYSRPKSVAIDGKLTITLVPYCSPRNLSSSWRKLPMFCDVLASHR
jgi:hypothetical protein